MKKILTVLCITLTTCIVLFSFLYHQKHSIPVVEVSYPIIKTLNSKIHCVGTLESPNMQYVLPSIGESISKLHCRSGDRVTEGDLLFSTISSSGKKDYYAPISGMIGHVSLPEYGEIIPGISFLQVIPTDSLMLHAELDEIYLSDIQEGQKVELIFEAFPSRNNKGIIHQITPYATARGGLTGWLLNQGTPSISLQIAITSNTSDLIPGLSASGNIITDTETDAILVPCTAVYSDGEAQYLFLYQDGKARKQFVTTGLYYDGYFQITSGIDCSDQVILNPSDSFTDGIKVVPHA